MEFQLDVLSDLSEVIKYIIPDFPMYANIGYLQYFYKYAVSCHWHPDLELSLVLEGSMDYFINGETVHIKAGQGIFINGRRLHYNYSRTETSCKYLVVTINPLIYDIGLRPVGEHVQNSFGLSGQDFLILNGEEDWHKTIFNLFFKINDELHSNSCNLFTAMSFALAVCGEVSNHIDAAQPEREGDLQWLTAWKMTSFIHRNYDEKISLPDIAAAGQVCRSKCCNLFARYVGQTPNSYLTSYRVQKSCEFLRDTSCSVSEVAMKCGFQSASYFTQVFQQQTGATPRDYREIIQREPKT